MEDCYPFLACWKKTGLKQFPRISALPEDVFLLFIGETFPSQTTEQEFRQNFRAALENKDLVTHRFLSVHENQLAENEAYERYKREMALQVLCVEIERKQGEQLRACLDAQKRIIKGESRKLVQQDLLNEVFPLSVKGGKAIILENHRRILKKVWQELRLCIREVRTVLFVPMTYSQVYDWEDDRTEDIMELFPGILTIFDKEELADITVDSSVSRTALQVIIRRLKRVLPPNFSSRTLADILYKTKG